MGNSTPPTPGTLGPYGAYALIALCCCTAIVLVAIMAMHIIGRWTTFSADSVFAVAVMVVSPAFLGVGISYFVSRTAVVHFDRADDRLG